MSKYKRHALDAHERGYYVDGLGVAYGPRGALKCHTTSTGYLRFSIHVSKPRERVHVLAHQLVAYQLFGADAFADGVVIMHLDKNRTNNTPTNIAIGTRSDAQLRVAPVMRAIYGANAARKLRRLTDAQVIDLRAKRAAGATLKELCKAFDICKATASYAVNGKTYT